jgi:flavin-dependent dehydrogenase
MEIKKIVIVGGGSAGWMSAATLIKHFPNNEIIVIESPNVPTVGVGESTIGQINEWLFDLGINDSNWMKFCDASYKLSIKFTDFYKKDAGAFHYPFGVPVYDSVHFPNGLQDWFLRKATDRSITVGNFAETFFPAVSMSESNKICENTNNEFPDWRFDRDVAYHFDAAKFGIWLREHYCMPKGVKLIKDDVADTIVNDDGIEKLILNSGDNITADLFIDCTGFKSLLLGTALDVEFDSYEDLLPNNSAWATRIPFTDKEAELEPYTNCTAIQNGWVWNIPLWSRVGTGYVYSDKFISDQEALTQFKDYLINHRGVKKDRELVESLEFKNIKMRIGIHKKIFHKNVCAIGLSAGFIEPLESSGLYTVHEFLLKLVSALGRKEITEFDRLAFNEGCRGDFRAFAEFVALHYALSHRDDTAYWQACRKREWPKSMQLGVYASYGIDDLIQRKYVTHRYDDSMGGTMCVATGLNFLPIDESTVNRVLYRNNALNYLKNLKQNCFPIWDLMLENRKRFVETLPTLYQHLKSKYTND